MSDAHLLWYICASFYKIEPINNGLFTVERNVMRMSAHLLWELYRDSQENDKSKDKDILRERLQLQPQLQLLQK